MSHLTAQLVVSAHSRFDTRFWALDWASSWAEQSKVVYSTAKFAWRLSGKTSAVRETLLFSFHFIFTHMRKCCSLHICFSRNIMYKSNLAHAIMGWLPNKLFVGRIYHWYKIASFITNWVLYITNFDSRGTCSQWQIMCWFSSPGKALSYILQPDCNSELPDASWCCSCERSPVLTCSVILKRIQKNLTVHPGNIMWTHLYLLAVSYEFTNGSW